jgi:hypothetical protein
MAMVFEIAGEVADDRSDTAELLIRRGDEQDSHES